MARNFIILALVLAFSCVSGVSAQDSDQETGKSAKVQKRKGKKNKAVEKQKAAIGKRITNGLSAVKLTEDQTTKMSELIESHFEDINSLKQKMDGFIGKNRKKMNEASKAARKEGKKWPDAMKAAYEAIGLSEEDQKTMMALNKERNGLIDTIKKEIVGSFSDEQKAAMAKARKAKGGKKKKGKKEGSEKTSVSINLPNMT